MRTTARMHCRGCVTMHPRGPGCIVTDDSRPHRGDALSAPRGCRPRRGCRGRQPSRRREHACGGSAVGRGAGAARRMRVPDAPGHTRQQVYKSRPGSESIGTRPRPPGSCRARPRPQLAAPHDETPAARPAGPTWRGAKPAGRER